MKNKKPKSSELEIQCAEYLAGWKRALADYENLKKELSLRETETRRYLVTDLVQSFLPVIDNFDAAVRHTPPLDALPPESKKTLENWLQGVVYIQKQFADSLASIGVERMKTIGEAFNPEFHEAGGTKHEEGKALNEILEEVQTGYAIAGRVIRPAKVIINE